MRDGIQSRRVLKLNASYEALGLIGVPRALSLVARGAVDIVELDGDRVLRSPRFTWAVPSVVRLKVYINVRKYERKGNLRIRIFVRDAFRCQYCGQVMEARDLTLDHIIPRSRGGTNDALNLCTACIPCNNRKGNRTPAEARMPLVSNPSAYTYGLDLAIAVMMAETRRPEWLPYLVQSKSQVKTSKREAVHR
jgi:5-methylcytosine-specific restriction endonuclease McrA